MGTVKQKPLIKNRIFSKLVSAPAHDDWDFDDLITELQTARHLLVVAAADEGMTPKWCKVAGELDYYQDYRTSLDGLMVRLYGERPYTAEEIAEHEAANDKRKQAALKRKATTEANRQRKLKQLEADKRKIDAELRELRKKIEKK